MRAGQYKCRHCGRICVEKRKGQKYCGEAICQRMRKLEWSRSKYASDPDYRANQRDSTDAWLLRQGGSAKYHRAYRRRRRESEDGGIREKPLKSLKGGMDRFCNDVSESAIGMEASLFAESATVLKSSANRDARRKERSIKPGIYRICPADSKMGANRDVILVELRVITG